MAYSALHYPMPHPPSVSSWLPFNVPAFPLFLTSASGPLLLLSSLPGMFFSQVFLCLTTFMSSLVILITLASFLPPHAQYTEAYIIFIHSTYGHKAQDTFICILTFPSRTKQNEKRALSVLFNLSATCLEQNIVVEGVNEHRNNLVKEQELWTGVLSINDV